MKQTGSGSVLLLVALTTFVAACSDAGASGSAHIDELPELQLTEQLRIGSVNDPDIGFSNIADIEIGDDGRVYVLEQQEHEVRVYDHSGRLLHQFGRQGSGPGEFELPRQIGSNGDTLWVTDIRLNRLSVFTTNGEFITSYSPTPIALELGAGVHARLGVGGMAADGTLKSSWSVMVPRDAPPPNVTLRIPVVRIDTTGAVLDTVRHVPFAFPAQTMIEVGGREVPVPAADPATPMHIEVDDGGVIIVDRPLAEAVDAGVLELARLSAAGDTIWQRELRYRPAEYTEVVVDTMLNDFRDIYDMFGVELDAVRSEVRDAMLLPPFQPAVTRARVGADGTLWLRLHDDGGATRSWVVLDPDGTPRGRVDLPRRSEIHWIEGNRLWVAEPDELDVPWLVSYSVGPSA